jgi:hypothetical protein
MAVIICAVVFFQSPIAIAVSSIVATAISCFVNALPNKKFINYSYGEQIKDIILPLLLSAVMFLCVWAVTLLKLSPLATILIQIPFGIIFYLILSFLTRMSPFLKIVEIVKNLKNGL